MMTDHGPTIGETLHELMAEGRRIERLLIQSAFKCGEDEARFVQGIIDDIEQTTGHPRHVVIGVVLPEAEYNGARYGYTWLARFRPKETSHMPMIKKETDDD